MSMLVPAVISILLGALAVFLLTSIIFTRFDPRGGPHNRLVCGTGASLLLMVYMGGIILLLDAVL